MISEDKLEPLIDGDVITYRAGFAAKDDEPLENSLHNVNTILNRIIERFPTHGQLFLSGSGNFRNKVATIKPYKGNRDPLHKPKYYDEIRRHMVDVWHANVIDGREADDAIGCAQWAGKGSTVIVSTDKDFNMLPGWKWNWVKDDLFYTTLEEANLFFYRQLMTGDTVDNVQGVPGIGPKTAAKLITPGMSVAEMEIVVFQEFENFYKDGGKALEETKQLLWIQRE